MIPAQFFDILGLTGFVVLFCIGLKMIKERKLEHYGYIILLISLMGILVDAYVVTSYFILK